MPNIMRTEHDAKINYDFFSATFECPLLDKVRPVAVARFMATEQIVLVIADDNHHILVPVQNDYPFGQQADLVRLNKISRVL